jgi:hypothetical protein
LQIVTIRDVTLWHSLTPLRIYRSSDESFAVS